MSHAAADKVREVFCRIIDAAPAQRAATLGALCDGDAALQARVQALLDAHGRAQDFLSQSVVASHIDVSASETLVPIDGPSNAPAQIGPYTLQELLGEGGLGSVYSAAQQHPIRRLVALKIIRRGMETRQLIARFEVERQALALMDHPSIAKVFDAGATEQGLPYFVMELVRGLPITHYCDQNKLSIRQRLQLFVQICSAIQHAHQKGVIHRDIKPSNVLVMTADETPVPKIIDFGIAKATEASVPENHTLTAAHQMVGTPLYMSPEQVRATAGGVDTRSDIYSLGVLLYEILTGATPIDSKTLMGTSFAEMQKVICETEPPPPSLRFARLIAPDAVAASRRSDPVKLGRMIRGELDWIVMKAIEKDRERRYETASGLGSDLTRYLQYEPVQAGPPGLRYRMRKFGRRYRLPLSVAGAVAASLLVGLGATTVGMVRALKAERAEATQKSAAIDELWNARLLQARAVRWSGRPGQRLEGLRALSAAASIRPALALRNEAIGCMALPDIEPTLNFDERHGDLPFRFDGTMLRYAARDAEGYVTVYRSIDRQALFRLPVKAADPDAYSSFSADGRFFAMTYATGDFGLRVWDVDQNRLALKVKGRVQSQFAIDFVRGGRSIAIAEDSNKIAVYDLLSEASSRPITSDGAVTRLDAQPNGNLIAAWGPDRYLRIFSLETGQQVSSNRLHFAELTAVVAWHPDGRRIGFYANYPENSTGPINEMYVVDAMTGDRISVMRGHLRTPQVIHFSDVGQIVASGAWDDTLRLWGAQSGQLLLTTSGFGALAQVSDDGAQLAARGGSQMHLLHATISRECRHFGGPILDNDYRSGDFSADGSALAAASRVGVRAWDVASGWETGCAPANGLRSLLFSPDNKRLLVSDKQGIRSMDAPRTFGPRLAAEPFEANLTGALAMSKDGRTVVYGMGDGSIFASDVGDIRKSVRLGKGGGFARFVAVSPDGLWASSSSRAILEFKVWNIKRQEPAATLPSSSTIRETGAMAFSPNGRWLVTADPNNYSWWEVGTWKLHHRVPRTSAVGSPLANYSDDGSVLAVASGYSILLLDPNTGAELATLDDPEPHGVSWMAFSKDGTQLAVFNTDPTVTVWNLRLIRRKLAEMKLDW